MTDTRTISQLEAEGYPWIGCECCKAIHHDALRRTGLGLRRGVIIHDNIKAAEAAEARSQIAFRKGQQENQG